MVSKNRHAAKLIGCGALTLAATSGLASAGVTLFDSQGFESPPYTNTGYNTGGLYGQPAGYPSNQKWSGAVQSTTTNPQYPYAYVDTYMDEFGTVNPVDPSNLQNVKLQDQGMDPSAYGYYYPTTNLINPTATPPTSAFTPSIANGTQQVDVVFQMAVTPSDLSTQGEPFFGIIAYGPNGQIGQLGVDATTGGVVGPTSGSGYPSLTSSATSPTFYNFELQMNFDTSMCYMFAGPIGGTFTEVGSSSFLSANTQFTDADISSLDLESGGPNVTGVSYFDNYSVTAVPEPVSAAAMMAATMALSLRRRRAR